MKPLNDEEKIDLKELTRLKKFHLSEYNRFKNLIRNSKTKIKEKNNFYGVGRRKILDDDKRKERDFAFSILKVENRELGTGELCDLLNESLEATKTYNSMTFCAGLGKYLRNDERISTRVGKTTSGKQSIFWGIKKEEE